MILLLSSTGCLGTGRHVPAEGVPAVAHYLQTADRAPARDEVIDTAPDLLWKSRLGRGTLGLPAMGDRVTVVATVDRWLYAFDTRTGRPFWRRRGDGPFGAGPLVADGLVITASEGPYARVAGVRLRDGRRRWQLRLGDVTAPLVAADGMVYGVTTAGVAFAIRTRDGSVAWRREIGPARSTPSLLGDRVAIVTLTDTLATIDRGSGRIVAQAPLPTSSLAPPTALDDSTLVLADPSGGVLAVAVPSGAVRWRVRTDAPVLGPVVVARDTLWALSTHCTLWRIPRATPAAADSVAIPDCVTEAAPTLVRDGVLVASVRGEVILFDPRAGRRVFTRQVKGALQHPPLVRRGQILVAPSFGEVVSFQ